MSEKEICSQCRLPKAQAQCDVCLEPVCKGCTVFVDEGTFAYEPVLPEILKHSRYCRPCHDEHVLPALTSYLEILERAKQVSFLTKAYKGYITVFKKAKSEIHIEGKSDRQETIMHLAFLAAREGYNALMLAEVIAKKVRNHAYQKSEWSGHGWPASIDQKKLEVEELRAEVWRRGN